MMALSVAELNAVLTQRCGAYMTAAGLTADTGALNDPVRWGLAALGFTPAGILTVEDADLAHVVTAQLTDALLDLAELRLLETCLTNMTAVTTRAGSVQQDFSDWSKNLQAILPMKRANVSKRFGAMLVLPLEATAAVRVRLKAL